MKKLLPLLLCILLLAGCAATYDGPTTAKTVLAAEEQRYRYFDGEVTEYYRTEYAYDIYGNQSVIYEYRDDEPLYKSILRYDEDGNLIRMTRYDVSGWFPRKTDDDRYRYDDQGRMIGSTHSEDPEITISYDDEAGTRTTVCDGNTIVEYFDKNGWVIRAEYPGTDKWEEYDRRPDGQWIAIRSYEGDQLVSTLERTFDEEGRVVHQFSTKDGVASPGFRWEYTDDSEVFHNGNGQRVTEYNPDGTIRARWDIDENGDIWCSTHYSYTEIQVPAGKEDTP